MDSAVLRQLCPLSQKRHQSTSEAHTGDGIYKPAIGRLHHLLVKEEFMSKQLEGSPLGSSRETKDKIYLHKTCIDQDTGTKRVEHPADN